MEELTYFAIVEDDRADKPPSAASHLTAVHQVLQLSDLDCALKPADRAQYINTQHIVYIAIQYYNIVLMFTCGFLTCKRL